MIGQQIGPLAEGLTSRRSLFFPVVLALLMNGCLDQPLAPALAREGVAEYTNGEGERLWLKLGEPKPIFLHDFSSETRYPLLLSKDEAFSSYSTYWLDSTLRVSRRDVECLQRVEDECVRTHLTYYPLAAPAPFGVGLNLDYMQPVRVQDREIDASWTKDGGRVLVELTSYKSPLKNEEMRSVRYTFDQSIFPVTVEWVQEDWTRTTWTRTALHEAGALPSIGSNKPRVAGDAISGYRVFPGEEEDDLGFGYPHSAPLDHLFQEHPEIETAYEEGCMVRLREKAQRESTNPGLLPSSGATAYFHYTIASEGKTFKAIVARHMDSLGQERFETRDLEENEDPVRCEKGHSDHPIRITSTEFVNRFTDLDLTYQSTPEFRLVYYEQDPSGLERSDLRFEMTVMPAWVDTNRSSVGYIPHILSVDTDGWIEYLYIDPTDHPRLGRAEPT